MIDFDVIADGWNRRLEKDECEGKVAGPRFELVQALQLGAFALHW